MKQPLLNEQQSSATKNSVLFGAAFLMATSSVGPGFLTQTAVFTQQLAASFAFVIIISLVLDVFAQMNVWRIIAVSGLRGQEIANKVLPGLGYVLAAFIIFGGLAFNIGNVAGAGLGLNAMLGIDPVLGAGISALFAIFVFAVKEAAKVMDRVAQVAGVTMLGLMIYVAFKTTPPVKEALANTLWPEQLSIFAIITLVGGTVGGYITFAGGHRLLDAGVKGQEGLPDVTKSSLIGIGVTGVMRVALFLAILGIVSQGYVLNEDGNPAAEAFQYALGDVGIQVFGVIMWAAAVTSVVGAAYTSVSFIRTFHPFIEKYSNWFIIGFIIVSTSVFLFIGRPVLVLILAGAANALILPLALGVMLIAAHRKDIVGTYKHPKWLTIPGIFVVIMMAIFSVKTLMEEIPQLFS